MADDGDRHFPSLRFDRPTSILVHGPSRDLVNLAVFALAEATSPQFQWVDIRVPGETRSALDPVGLGWVPGDRCWAIESPTALRPTDIGANYAMFAYLRADESPAAIAQVTDFLRLPDISQRILATRPPESRPGVVAVPNAHRVMATFGADQVPSILNAHRNSGFSVYVGYAEAIGAGGEAFDLVLHLDGVDPADWASCGCRSEKGVDSGPLAEGSVVRLGDIPLFARAMTKATRRP